MSKKRFITLGTAGWMPTATRQTMCFALEVSDELIFFDLGTGICNLASEVGEGLLSRHDRIVVFLSHYHLDHVAGIVYLPRFFKDKEVIIAGPGLGVYSKSVNQILDRLCSSPYFAQPLSQYPMQILFQDIGSGLNHLGNLDVNIRLQEHSDPSLGIRVDDVTYITDTKCTSDALEFSKGSVILVHEAMLDADESQNSGEVVHSNAIEVANLANAAKVENLLLVHLNPTYSEERLDRMHQDSIKVFQPTILGKDLLDIHL